MAATSLALVALAGTAALAVIELVARRLVPRGGRSDAAALVTAIALAGGVALVIAALATIEVDGSAALLAAAVTCVALLAALVARTGERGD